jgi:hypothetical protein
MDIVNKNKIITYRYITNLNLANINRRRKPSEGPLEEGIVILAIQQQNDGSFHAGASFCNPSDIMTNCYNKKKGRLIAANRLNSDKVVSFVMEKEKYNRGDIKFVALKQLKDAKLLTKREWVEKLVSNVLGDVKI